MLIKFGGDFMKKLMILIFTIIMAIALYTCSSPTAVEGIDSTTVNLGSTFYSTTAIFNGGTGNSSLYLGVTISNAESISIGFYSSNSTTAATLIGTAESITSSGTNTISGVYPVINFQNGVISGTINISDQNQIKVTFQQNNSPYARMQDVVCKN